MCRLFGFRSVLKGQVHQSLLNADNALGVQSLKHPDGWGVAYYLGGAPHIIRSTEMANSSPLFQKVSGIVSSRTVLAHVRKSTVGSNNILNTHPFQYGKWVFAHNGNIKNFSRYKDEIIHKISPKFKPFILGETDSELLFFFLMSYFYKEVKSNPSPLSFDQLSALIRKGLYDLQKIIGPFHEVDEGSTETFLSFILTNGEYLIGHQGGKKLYFSTHKSSCPESSTCSSYDHSCENKKLSGKVNHFIVSSEPIKNENIWEKLKPGEIVGVDTQMNFFKT